MKTLPLKILLLLLCCFARAENKSPNLMMIMTDDLDVESFDMLIKGGWLPNIEKYFVKEGVRFSNSFVTDPVCCPSRATFLSGQYSHNHGVLTVSRGITYWLKDGKPSGELSTIATWLQKQNYYTGHIGKYLNGYGMGTSQEYVPPGYDDWQGLLDPFTYRVYNYRLNDNGKVITYGSKNQDYQTDIIAKRTVEFLEDHQKIAKDKPFFAMVAPMAPHIEVLARSVVDDVLLGYVGNYRDSIRPAPRHLRYADGLKFNGELPELASFNKPSFSEADVSDKIAYIQNLPRLNDSDKRAVAKQHKDRLAAMLAVDDLVGSVMDKLKATGELDNTVVLFTSDNGYQFGEHRLSSKLSPYEESIRVPLLARGPGVAKGKTCDKIVLNNDLAPTFANLGNATPERDVDGRSIVPLFSSPTGVWSRKQFIIDYFLEQGLSAMYAGTPFEYILENFSAFGGLQDFPTYKALRTQNPLTQTDTLFVNWHEGLDTDDVTDPTNLGPPTSREYYNLKSDPFQLQNSLGTLLDANRRTYERLLEDISQCKGESCRSLEDK